MSKTKISVCLTHFERPEKLDATLESLAAQTRLPDELFLWDDCSRRDPAPVVKRWADRFPHFVYHRNAVNLGMPGNLNAVIAQATGEYVANLHDADVFSPFLLEKWSSALDRHPEASLVFCADSRRSKPSFNRSWPQPTECSSGREFFKRYYLGRIDSIIWGTVMMRRSAYSKLLPFKSDYKAWADVDMWMRVCGIGDIAYVDDQMITLDHTPTEIRRFSFAREALVQGMILENIRSLYQGKELAHAISVQKRAWFRCWFRWMLGRLRHGDVKSLGEGFAYLSGAPSRSRTKAQGASDESAGLP